MFANFCCTFNWRTILFKLNNQPLFLRFFHLASIFRTLFRQYMHMMKSYWLFVLYDTLLTAPSASLYAVKLSPPVTPFKNSKENTFYWLLTIDIIKSEQLCGTHKSRIGSFKFISICTIYDLSTWTFNRRTQNEKKSRKKNSIFKRKKERVAYMRYVRK